MARLSGAVKALLGLVVVSGMYEGYRFALAVGMMTHLHSAVVILIFAFGLARNDRSGLGSRCQ